jgi:plastocyanin
VRVRLAFLAAVALLTAATLAGSGSAVPPPKLVGTVGPGFTITLMAAGKKVTTLKAGTYVMTVVDKSNIHDFHLMGPGVNKKTSVAGTVSAQQWPLTLKKGTYRYQCDPHAAAMKGSFTVT